MLCWLVTMHTLTMQSCLLFAHVHLCLHYAAYIINRQSIQHEVRSAYNLVFVDQGTTLPFLLKCNRCLAGRRLVWRANLQGRLLALSSSAAMAAGVICSASHTMTAAKLRNLSQSHPQGFCATVGCRQASSRFCVIALSIIIVVLANQYTHSVAVWAAALGGQCYTWLYTREMLKHVKNV